MRQATTPDGELAGPLGLDFSAEALPSATAVDFGILHVPIDCTERLLHPLSFTFVLRSEVLQGREK
jgi:hypothetical protein